MSPLNAVKDISDLEQELETLQNTIAERDRENEILLGITNQMIGMRDKNDFLNIVNQELRKYVPYDDNNILVYNKESKSYRIYAYDVMPKRLADPVFQAMMKVEYPDINSQRESFQPQIVEVENLVKTGSDWGKAIDRMGVKELVHLKLIEGNQALGQLVLLSETSKNFTESHLSLLHRISYQLSQGLANVLANEDLKVRENEKTVLLSLGKHMAQTRSRKGLQDIMKEELKKLFYFSHSHILVFSDDKKSYENFVSDPFAGIKALPENQHYKTTTQTVDFSECSVSKYVAPVFLDLDMLSEANMLPEVLRLHHDSGIKEMVTVGMRDDKEVFGIINFYSDRNNNFTKQDIDLIQGIANQIAIAVDNIIAYENVERKEKETQLLLSFSAAVDKVKDRNGLVHIIRDKLSTLLSFTDIALTIYKSETRTFQVFAHQVAEKMGGHPKFTKVIIPEYPVEDGIHEVALRANAPVIVDIEDAMRSPNKHAGTQFIFDSGIKKMLLVKLTSNGQTIGFLNFLSAECDAFDKINHSILKGITEQLSTAISNVMSREEILRRDQENEALLAVSTAISSNCKVEEIMQVISSKLGAVVYFNDICVSQYNLQKGNYKVLSYAGDLVCEHPDFYFIPTTEFPIQDGIHNVVIASEDPVSFSFERLRTINMVHVDFMIQAGVRECLCVRLVHNNEVIGALVLTSDKNHGFSDQDCKLIHRLSHHLATGVSNIIANQKLNWQLEEIKKYKEQLEEANEYLQEEANEGYTYNDIIGGGIEMQKVFQLLSQVSFTNSTVLLLGETGTGKELIARAIHNSSGRKDKLMVKVNCAALPASLIESELFGHERGSFTGATERRVGKFELANRGTLFLDEIGEMPMDLQVKLLRAIQEREIERVGGRDTIKVDVRIIAATNRNLLNEVNEGRFRSDLYYRLNVFPITLPPLRSRKEDIPALASHFVDKFSKNNGKKISQISSNAMKELTAYNWPGNVRELEHLIERSILMSVGSVIRHMHLPNIKSEDSKSATADIYSKTHEENERDYIIAVLNSCGGKIYGVGGAAQILDLKVGTLNSKIKKLGIRKEQIIYKKS